MGINTNERTDTQIKQADVPTDARGNNEPWVNIASSVWQQLGLDGRHGMVSSVSPDGQCLDGRLSFNAATLYDSPQRTITRPEANRPEGGHNGNKPERGGDPGKEPYPRANAEVLAERMRLQQLESKLPEKDRQRFENDMARFEQRAARQGLSPSEVQKTYQQIERLLEAREGKVSAERRVQLAEQVMHQLGDPMSISQGMHDTCNVTTVETRTYRNSPAAAAKLVTDVALTGQYTTPMGNKVVLDNNSLIPDTEARNNPPGDGKRSFASQLFQVTAVNLYYSNRDENGNPTNNSDVHYTQNPNYPKGGKTGERLYHTKTNKDVTDENNKPVDSPWITTWGLQDICNRIAGKTESGLVLANTEYERANKPGYTNFSSERELGDRLSKLQKNGQLPVILEVDTRNPPFNDPNGGCHVVTIRAYSPETGRVLVDNQWSRNSHRTYSLHEVYQATRQPGQ